MRESPAMIETERFDLAWSWPLLSGGAEAPGLCRRRALLTAHSGSLVSAAQVLAEVSKQDSLELL
jgi:hypothetical protein